MIQRLHIAVFEDETTFLDAAQACMSEDTELVDAYSPYPIHELDHCMGIKKTRLPWVTLIGALVGLAIGLWFQYWASATDWPLDVGGKPWDSFPAFVPVAFEMTILLAGLATIFGLLWRCGLFPGRSPRRTLDRVTDDRFALVVKRRSDALTWPEIDDLLRRHGAIEQWEEPS